MSEILIDHVLLDRVTKAAKESPRLRMNYNFHESLSSPSQRLLNALEQYQGYSQHQAGRRMPHSSEQQSQPHPYQAEVLP